MRVRAKVNESKVSLVQTGQPVKVLIDAFPDRPLRGGVTEVVPISTPINGSDVRIYYVNVDIADGFDELRPGLSAEVIFKVDSRHKVTRVPVNSLRWVGNRRPYVAIYDRSPSDAAKDSWYWQEIEIGVSDSDYVEVTKGLAVGDRIVASPRSLPAPEPTAARPGATRVAHLSSDSVK
jgi:HlyD family secretion protein